MPVDELNCNNKISKKKLTNMQDMLDYIALFYENLIKRIQQQLDEMK